MASSSSSSSSGCSNSRWFLHSNILYTYLMARLSYHCCLYLIFLYYNVISCNILSTNRYFLKGEINTVCLQRLCRFRAMKCLFYTVHAFVSNIAIHNLPVTIVATLWAIQVFLLTHLEELFTCWKGITYHIEWISFSFAGIFLVTGIGPGCLVVAFQHVVY